MLVLFLPLFHIGLGMLKALARYMLRNEAPQTPARPSEPYVTAAEVDAIIAKFEQRQEFELGEWFDKFSALHARTEKRVQRDQKRQGNGAAHPEQPSQMPSALVHRKPWSV